MAGKFGLTGPLTEAQAQLVEQLVRQYCRAREVYLNSVIGPATVKAEARMEAIYKRAVAAGLDEVLVREIGY